MTKKENREPKKATLIHPESALCEEPVHPGEGGYGFAARPKADGSLDYSDSVSGRLQHFIIG